MSIWDEMFEDPKVTVQVYLDNGLVFEYDVKNQASAREHADAIVRTGYRSVQDGTFTAYPPHRILKVKFEGASTSYPDRVRGT